MEILKFNSNVDAVKLAKKLLTDQDNPYPYCYIDDLCYYREPGVKGKEARRCIFGRLMYGNIPEDHSFWDLNGSASDAMFEYPETFKRFPWMSRDLMDKVQTCHDDVAAGLLCTSDLSARWDDILQQAMIADEEWLKNNA